MCSHLSKAQRFISSHFSSSSSPFHHHLSLLLRFSLSTQTQSQQQKELPFIAQYLISSFSFSPDRALKYSNTRHLAAIKSPDRPKALIKFLKDTGLSDSQIKSVISLRPILLGYNVEKTLKPKVRELVENGFSGDLLVQLIRYNPAALCLNDTLSRLLFWKDFVGNSDEALLKMITMNPLLIDFGIDKNVVPVINLLKEYGLSNQHNIMSLLGVGSRCLKRSPDSLRQTLELIEELGILRGSKIFRSVLRAVGGFSKDTIKRKLEFFMVTYGWSEEEVHAALTKYPSILTYSEDKVKSNMDFLTRNAGFESRNIAFRPQLLGYSLERVLIPRYTVLSALQAKGLKKTCSLFTASLMSESNFLERYVVPHEKDVPGLPEAYAAAYGGKVPI